MNKKDVMARLLALLNNILSYSGLQNELLPLIAGSGFEAKFLALFVSRLQSLASLGIQATVMREFEPLGGGLYSMHLSGKGFNIRILYGFLPNGQPALLLAFHERAGKYKTDYSTRIPIAQLRLAEMRKEFDHETE